MLRTLTFIHVDAPAAAKSLCRDAYERAHNRYQEEMAELLAQPVVDGERVAFVSFLISALDKQFHGTEELAS